MSDIDFNGFRIDHSTGTPILMYKDCSVIESEVAEWLMQLIANHRTQPPAEDAKPEQQEQSGVIYAVHGTSSINFVERLLAEIADLTAAQQPEALAKHQPCGCVLCTCEDEKQCQGCGAKHCGNRTNHPPYVKQQPAEQHPDDAAVDRFSAAPKAPQKVSNTPQDGSLSAEVDEDGDNLAEYMSDTIQLPRAEYEALRRDAERWRKCKTMNKQWWLDAMAEAAIKGGRSLDESIDTAIVRRILDGKGK